MSRAEAGKIRTLRFYFKNLHDQGSCPHDISFRFTSVSFEECETFRKHLNKTLASQGDDVVNASDLLSYVTSARIDSWKGKTEAFITHWQDQIRLC